MTLLVPRPADRLPAWVFNGLLPVVFWAIALCLLPIASVFQFDSDEGQELIKAILYNQGFQLFTEIWSDQPPLLTVLLAPGLRLSGDSVVVSRLLMLGFATVLVWSFAQILRRVVGDRYALMGAGLLIFTANFLRLSVSVMIGMPAIACLVFALYCGICYQESGRWLWLIGSAIAAGISLQFKMFTLVLFPLWGGFLWAGAGQLSLVWRTRSAWCRLMVWSGIVLVTFLLLGISLGDLRLDTILVNHVRSDLKSVFQRENSLHDVCLFYLQELDYVVLALLGIFTQVKSVPFRGQFTLHELPIAWLVWVTAFLLNHKPIWYHHYSLMALPLTWLAVQGLKACIEQIQAIRTMLPPQTLLRRFPWRKAHRSALALLFLGVALPAKITILQFFNQTLLQQTEQYWQVAQHIQIDPSANKRDPKPWLFTDIPMYGVYLHMNIPPEIATLSRKRIAAQEFNEQALKALIQKYDLQQFVIGRFPEVQSFLEQALPAQLEMQKYPIATYSRHVHHAEK